ncbi:Protein of unknown function [Anaplasma phagocytophilum]|nr:Protein of unknown function [Anaplasma phagocytophilum]
MAETQKL